MKSFACIDALQTGDTNQIATPADWRPGDKVIIPPSITNEAAERDLAHKAGKKSRSYLRLTAGGLIDCNNRRSNATPRGPARGEFLS